MNDIPLDGNTRRKWRRLPILVGLCVISACSTEPSPPLLPELSPEEAAGLVYVVKPGDALSVIALQHGESYRNIARWNDLAPPYTIRPGQRLRLTPPPTTGKSPETRGEVRSTSPIKPKETAPESAKPIERKGLALPEDSKTPENTKTVGAVDIMEERFAERISWQWPSRGKILNDFSSNNQGIDIDGREGDPVYAAAEGKVVYSGTGIIGYGPLIILKHNNTYLSAYAHNRQLLVKEGDRVTRGQQIADMGRDQRRHVVLHFEIRRNSKSVDPLPYLPQR
ncbi:lipoprotein NlpD [Gammaproteobacteria bacterium]